MEQNIWPSLSLGLQESTIIPLHHREENVEADARRSQTSHRGNLSSKAPSKSWVTRSVVVPSLTLACGAVFAARSFGSRPSTQGDSSKSADKKIAAKPRVKAARNISSAQEPVKSISQFPKQLRRIPLKTQQTGTNESSARNVIYPKKGIPLKTQQTGTNESSARNVIYPKKVKKQTSLTQDNIKPKKDSQQSTEDEETPEELIRRPKSDSQQPPEKEEEQMTIKQLLSVDLPDYVEPKTDLQKLVCRFYRKDEEKRQVHGRVFSYLFGKSRILNFQGKRFLKWPYEKFNFDVSYPKSKWQVSRFDPNENVKLHPQYLHKGNDVFLFKYGDVTMIFEHMSRQNNCCFLDKGSLFDSTMESQN